MIEMTEALAGRKSFIRVDLYDIGRPIFGELTLHPEEASEDLSRPGMM